jgi:hypothetical protein
VAFQAFVSGSALLQAIAQNHQSGELLPQKPVFFNPRVLWDVITPRLTKRPGIIDVPLTA